MQTLNPQFDQTPAHFQTGRVIGEYLLPSLIVPGHPTTQTSRLLPQASKMLTALERRLARHTERLLPRPALATGPRPLPRPTPTSGTTLQRSGAPKALNQKINPPTEDMRNRAAFERYKSVLRAEMEKPHVVDTDLKKLVDRIYKQHAKIGSGSTAAAIRHELKTGQRVFEKFHSQKGREMITKLEKWLKTNPNASHGDRAAAENIIKDIRNALGE